MWCACATSSPGHEKAWAARYALVCGQGTARAAKPRNSGRSSFMLGGWVRVTRVRRLRRTVLRRVLAQAQIQRVLDEARRHHIIGSTHVSCKAAAILRCASNAGMAHLYYLHKSSSKCNQTSTSRGRTSQSFITRKPKYYYYYYYPPFSLNLSQTKQQNAEFGM